jgi:purine-binding chemotaxis protein CheW
MSHLNEKTNNVIEMATFYVGTALFGMDILKVQEINKILDLTAVPQAPEYVKGILNLRGQIVTIIDLGIKLGLPGIEISPDTRNIIVNSKNEYIGLLVDRIGDVERTSEEKIEPAPANINGITAQFFEGVYKKENSLVGILNVEKVLKEEL